MGAGVVIKEKTARRVGATPDWGARAFHEKLGSGAGDRGEEPIEAAFAGNKLEGPGALLGGQFVVPFGDAQNFVDGFGPGHRERLLFDERGENGAEGFAETEDAQKYSIDSLRLGREQGPQATSTIIGNEFCILKEGDKFTPGKITGGRGEIGEVESETSGDKRMGEGGHITSKCPPAGYSRTASRLKAGPRKPCDRIGRILMTGCFKELG